jgi:ABC-type nitrate/sulfonate/bicarbonate transport system substrate-binding protein
MPIGYKHRFAVRAAVAISIVIIAGYFVVRTLLYPHKPAGPPEKTSISFSMPHVLVAVAQMKEYFTEEGLKMTSLLRSHGKAALDDVLNGKTDFCSTAETPAMLAIMKGEKIAIIASIQTSTRNNAVVARMDSGIIKPPDLKGRTIATTRGTTGDFFLDAFLAARGISRKEIRFVDLKPEEMPDALTKGLVDAVAAFGSSLVQVRAKLGSRGITFYDEDLYTQSFIIVAKQEYISRNPETVRKVLRALLRAEDFTSRNPPEARKMVADLNGIEPGLVDQTLGDSRFSVKLDQSLVLSMEDEARWAVKKGIIRDVAGDVNYLDFIYFAGLESVKPKAVRILR